MDCPIRESCKIKSICTHWQYAEYCGMLPDEEKELAKIEEEKKKDAKNSGKK
jgi:hypothetical protein